MTFTSKSEKETYKIAEEILEKALEQNARPVVIAFYGELGAGKTTFVKALAGILGIKDEVRSPTFLLIREYDLPVQAGLPKKYQGIERLIHVDAYRIDDSSELSDLGLEQFMGDCKSLVVVEWADRVENLLPGRTIRIKFKIVGETEREISVS